MKVPDKPGVTGGYAKLTTEELIDLMARYIYGNSGDGSFWSEEHQERAWWRAKHAYEALKLRGVVPGVHPQKN